MQLLVLLLLPENSALFSSGSGSFGKGIWEIPEIHGEVNTLCEGCFTESTYTTNLHNTIHDAKKHIEGINSD